MVNFCVTNLLFLRGSSEMPLMMSDILHKNWLSLQNKSHILQVTWWPVFCTSHIQFNKSMFFHLFLTTSLFILILYMNWYNSVSTQNKSHILQVTWWPVFCTSHIQFNKSMFFHLFLTTSLFILILYMNWYNSVSTDNQLIQAFVKLLCLGWILQFTVYPITCIVSFWVWAQYVFFNFNFGHLSLLGGNLTENIGPSVEDQHYYIQMKNSTFRGFRVLMFLSSGKDISVASQKRFLGNWENWQVKAIFTCNLRENSQIDFFTQSVFWTPGEWEGGGGLQLDALKISKKSIFDKTNFWNLTIFLNL